jgi:hypothetical protein
VHERVEGDVEATRNMTYFPFGLGGHTCMGRRLAVPMVDAMVRGLLQPEIDLYQSIAQDIFVRMPWEDRISPITAAYNFPTQAVYVELGKAPKNENDEDESFGNYHLMRCF